MATVVNANGFTDFLKSAGAFIDKAIPFALGARTKIAVIACPIIAKVEQLNVVPAPYAAALPIAQIALCTAAPWLAFAGFVRNLPSSTPPSEPAKP